jgi:predicted enzyme related to lactoylglutathione lyase
MMIRIAEPARRPAMFTPIHAVSAFSVDDLDPAMRFYRDTLGLQVEKGDMGTLTVTLPGGAQVLVYPKPNHEPATFTIINFIVDDVEKAVDALNERGVKTDIYDDADLAPGMGTDEKGIMRGRGPDIAWFRDPAGNVLAVLKP